MEDARCSRRRWSAWTPARSVERGRRASRARSPIYAVSRSSDERPSAKPFSIASLRAGPRRWRRERGNLGTTEGVSRRTGKMALREVKERGPKRPGSGSEVRAPAEVWAMDKVRTPIGELWLVTRNERLWGAELEPRWPQLAQRLMTRHGLSAAPGRLQNPRRPGISAARSALRAYFRGQLDAPARIELDLQGVGAPEDCLVAARADRAGHDDHLWGLGGSRAAERGVSRDRCGEWGQSVRDFRALPSRGRGHRRASGLRRWPRRKSSGFSSTRESPTMVGDSPGNPSEGD